MSPVVTWSTKLPVRLAQRAAYARASATSARSEALSPGTSGGPVNSGSGPQLTAGRLPAVPRESQATMSKRRCSASGTGPAKRRASTPDGPGPPKFTKRVPMRCEASWAGSLMTGRVKVRPSGSP